MSDPIYRVRRHFPLPDGWVVVDDTDPTTGQPEAYRVRAEIRVPSFARAEALFEAIIEAWRRLR